MTVKEPFEPKFWKKVISISNQLIVTGAYENNRNGNFVNSLLQKNLRTKTMKKTTQSTQTTPATYATQHNLRNIRTKKNYAINNLRKLR